PLVAVEPIDALELPAQPAPLLDRVADGDQVGPRVLSDNLSNRQLPSPHRTQYAPHADSNLPAPLPPPDEILGGRLHQLAIPNASSPSPSDKYIGPEQYTGSSPRGAFTATDSSRIQPQEELPQSGSVLEAPTIHGDEQAISPQLRREILLRAARNAVARQEYSSAISRFEELLIEFPMDHDARLEYAGVLNRIGRLTEARQQYAQLTTLEPQNVDFQLKLVDLLIQEGKHTEAEVKLRSIIRQGAADGEVYVVLARVLAWQEKLDEATQLYEQLLQQSSFDGSQRSANIARLLLEIRRPGEALAIINDLLRYAPMDPELCVDQILATARMGDLAAAHQLIANLANIGSVESSQRTQLADALYREGYYRDALASYLHAAQGAPHDILTQTKIVRTNVHLYDLSAAEATLEALAPVSNNPAVRLELARYLTAAGEHSRAYAVFRDLLASNPEDADAIQGIGELYQAIGDNRRAELEFRRALSREPNDTAKRSLLARSQAAQLKIGDALSTLQTGGVQGSAGFPYSPATAAEAVSILTQGGAAFDAENLARGALAHTNDISAISALRSAQGFALLEQGKTIEAVHAFETARQGPNGDRPEIRYGLYRCFVKTGREDEAYALLQPELSAFGPATWERVQIANRAVKDCNYQLAMQVLNQALLFDPYNLFLMVRLGEVTAEANRCQGGCDDRQHFQQALQHSPSNTRAALGLARSYGRTNHYDASKAAYMNLLSTFPSHDVALLEHARLTYAWEGVD
ncbi:MAG: tetratricopeptide repeat protein, partial [Planctomycetales bacterium]|nr:tetratricopeptide repeat protein [Planctomycetales bacterium]